MSALIFPPSNAVNPTADRFFLRTLGGFELCAVNADGTIGVRLLGPGKPLALLAYCACTPYQRHSRDKIAQLLWGDAPVERLRQNVRQALWRLRRTLGDALTTGDDAIAELSAAFASDHQLFSQALERDDLDAALAAYAGPFLAGLSMPGGDEFEDWAAGERQRLEQMLRQRVEPALTELTGGGRHTAARALLERLTIVAGDVPDTHRIATKTYLTIGDRPAARRAAERLELRLADLGADEAASATALIARARRDVPKADQSDPRTVWAMDLTGREEVFATVTRAWKRARQGETHAVLLTGVAGVGKSRLLAAMAARCATGSAIALVIRANPGEREIPFSLAAQLARALAEQPGAMGIDPTSARELSALDPALAATFRVSAAVHDNDGEATRRRASALYDLVSAITEQQPLALLFDDLHWCDPASRQLLASVVARAVRLPLLVVAAARGIATDFLTHPNEVRLPLLPLDLASTMAAIRSCGTWPDDPGAGRFIQRLAESAAGIPQHVIERLSLAVEKGWLSSQRGTWTSADWTQACADVMVTSPLDHRLLSCAVRERGVLLTLALAGTSLPLRVVHRAVEQASMAQVIDALAVLEAKGLVTAHGDRWEPSHDLILERMIGLSTDTEQEAAHAQLAESLLADGESTSIIAATRHFLNARLEARAALVFAQIVARCRRSGDPRHAWDLATDIVGARAGSHDIDVLVRAIPWWQRSATTSRRLATAATALLLAALALGAWTVMRLPALVAGQGVVLVDNALVYGPDVYRLTPPLSARGRATRSGTESGTESGTGQDSTVVRARIVRGNAEIVMGGEARMDSSGTVTFGALRLRTTDTLLTIRFEADGYRPATIDIPIRQDKVDVVDAAAVQIRDGRLGSQRMTGREARIDVAPGAPITGVIQLQYTASWRAASVWLAMTPTWGDPTTIGRDVIPVATPVRDNVIDVPIEYVAPDMPGHYWILMIISAEPSGGFILSRSNWTMGAPVWGDGNDVASLPDSVIRTRTRTGSLTTRTAYFRDERIALNGSIGGCLPNPSGRPAGVVYCDLPIALAAIEVVVK
jgi:DNA-binding SARP family transcriptional activator